MPPPKIGVVDVLSRNAFVDDAIRRDVDNPNLGIIANASPTRNATDLIASPHLASLIGELRDDYEYVILDSPPLIGIIDGRLIAPFVDVALLAIRWGKTQDDAVGAAIKALRSGNVKAISAVLTQASMRKVRRMHYGDAAGKYHKQYSKYYQS